MEKLIEEQLKGMQMLQNGAYQAGYEARSREVERYAAERIGSCDEPCEECRWGRALMDFLKGKLTRNETGDHDHKDEACSVCPKVGVDVAEREEE